MSLDAERQAALQAAKLRALASSRWSVADDARAASFPEGASLVDAGAGRAWVLVGADGDRRLGGALAVALRGGCPELHVLAPDAAVAGVLARRAGLFAAPPTVWTVDGATLVAAVAAPPAPDEPPAPEAELYRPVLEAAGLEPVVEGGVLIGELRGLEVARVVVGADGAAYVEAGVGRFDREVGAMMFAELSETDSVARAVDLVARHRVPGTDRHPLGHLVSERWLRAVVLARPDLVGAAALAPVGSAVPRRNLTETGIATAVGTDRDGRPVVVACSTGVYLDLAPAAADDRLTHAPDARLVLAVPEVDAVPLTSDLAALLARPAEVVPIPGDWRRLAEDGA